MEELTIDSTDSNLFEVSEDGISIVRGNMIVDGNLEVGQQLKVKEFELIDPDSLRPVMTTTEDSISFRKMCDFSDGAQFNNGKTLIGTETTYDSACVTTETLHAKKRLVVSDSMFKIEGNDIYAQTFKMSLHDLEVSDGAEFNGDLNCDNTITGKTVKANEVITQKIYADSIAGNKISFDNINLLKLYAGQSLTTKELIVEGTSLLNGGVTIKGTSRKGEALVVDGGQIIANYGIESHTRNNRFQTLQIYGSGTKHDVCFKIDSGVDSLIEGDVTIHNSNLVLDNSRLASDNIIVTPLGQTSSASNGVLVTTKTDWDDYKAGMVTEYDTRKSLEGEYNPYESVRIAMERNQGNYVKTGKNIRSILNPINYMMERGNPSVPKKFDVKPGIYRIDSNGNALHSNLVAKTGTFNTLNAYEFNVNRMGIDKLNVTSVAANVVDTDNLLASRGIAEFDGSVNSKADIFIEKGSSINIDEDASVTFRDGASLTLKNGARFEMGSNTSMKMSGDVELDLSRLVFFDSITGNRYRISFREANGCEGRGIVMDYHKVDEVSTQTVVDNTSRDALELDAKLKSLGL